MGKITETIVAVRGGGDLATGVIQKLVRAGFKVAVLETAEPLMIRRTVALGTAVINQSATVEDMTAVLANPAEAGDVWAKGQVPVLVDPEGLSLQLLQPQIVVDAILAKKNLGTTKAMAPVTIALGPGFNAPSDVDVVIETMRGHSLGKLIFNGSSLPNTGTPGLIEGKDKERVIHAPASGIVIHKRAIGDQVAEGEILFTIDEQPVRSTLSGTLRGLIAEGTKVAAGLKVADIDPRSHVDCWSISDKARALGGAVLEAALFAGRQKNLF